MIGRTLSHYEVLEAIGSGGMGEVYRARDARLERDVAIKLLPPGRLQDEAARANFRREARMLSRLSHPNVQTVYDFDSHGDVDFLVTEFVRGQTLSDRLAKGGLPLAEVLRLGQDLAAGLAAAHERGIVHRDLKPANLRIDDSGRLKILDFGLAKPMAVARESATTLSGVETHGVAGTPFYMAPEQRAGGPADGRTDLYAAGLVLREMWAGSRTPRTKPPRRLARIVRRCLEEDPARRYASAAALGEALRSASSPLRRIVPWAAMLALTTATAGSLWLYRPAAGPPIRSVVALPSELLGSHAEAFLSEAFPNTISTQLAQIDGLEVKLPPSSQDLDRFGRDLDRLAGRFEVAGVVLSTVTATETGFVLNVRLVDAATRNIVWSDEYDGVRAEYRGIIRRAAEGLSAHLGGPIGALPEGRASSVELAFQRGLYHSNRYAYHHQSEDFEASLAALEEALGLDPGFADAAGELAGLYVFRFQAGIEPEASLAELQAWARRAIAIDPESGAGWTRLAMSEILHIRRDAAVTRLALRAVRFGSRYARAHNALSIHLSGISSRLALAAAREAARLDPLDPTGSSNAALYLHSLGRDEEALAESERALDVEPGFWLPTLLEASVALREGQLDRLPGLVDELEALTREGRLLPVMSAIVRDAELVVRADPELAPAALDHLSARLALRSAAQPSGIIVGIASPACIASKASSISARGRVAVTSSSSLMRPAM